MITVVINHVRIGMILQAGLGLVVNGVINVTPKWPIINSPTGFFATPTSGVMGPYFYRVTGPTL